MFKGIYTPLSGSLAQERVLEIIANNLANTNTNGFKGEKVTFSLVEPEPYKYYRNPLPPANYKQDLSKYMPFVGNDISYVSVAEITRDLSQGPAIETHNRLDLMIENEGYFTIHTLAGLRYTRDGAFSLNADGALVTKLGDPVLGEKGVIYLRNDQFEINSRGEIWQDGRMVDRLLIYNFKHPQSLERVGDNYFYFEGDKDIRFKVENPSIKQGFLEGSNVNAIENLTAMILAHRSYEAYQKAISNYDKMMDKSANSIGEIRV